jgi:hypothetical protein
MPGHTAGAADERSRHREFGQRNRLVYPFEGDAAQVMIPEHRKARDFQPVRYATQFVDVSWFGSLRKGPGHKDELKILDFVQLGDHALREHDRVRTELEGVRHTLGLWYGQTAGRTGGIRNLDGVVFFREDSHR